MAVGQPRLLLAPAGGAPPGAELLSGLYATDTEFRASFERFMGGARSAEVFFSGAMDLEIGGAWFIWRLREAAAATGQARSAAEAAAFYARLAREINTACEDGRLDCAGARSTLRPRLRRMHVGSILLAVPRTAEDLATLPHFSTSALIGHYGSPVAMAEAARFLRAAVAPSQQRTAVVPALEASIVAWRTVLPTLALLALVAWGWHHPFAKSRESGAALWWLAASLLALVAARIVLLSVIHATAWPGAASTRYVAAAHPLLMLFVFLTFILLWQQRLRRR